MVCAEHSSRTRCLTLPISTFVNQTLSRGTMKQAVAIINLTPLIDVLLVLLIIFMVISPKKPHRFESQIPEKPRQHLTRLSFWSSRSLPVRIILNRTEVTHLKTRKPLYDAYYASGVKAITAKIETIDVVKGAGGMPIGLQIERLDN